MLNLGYSEHLQLPTWWVFFVVVVFIPGKRSFCHEYIQFLPKKKGAGILEQSSGFLPDASQ